MPAAIHGGAYSFDQALHLVFEMSGITTALVSIVWLLSPLIHKQQTWIGLAVKTGLETGLVLLFYTVAVLLWRGMWGNINWLQKLDASGFMPIVGSVNAEFFMEFLWLEYLVCVTPLMALLSGLLTPSFDFLQKQR